MANYQLKLLNLELELLILQIRSRQQRMFNVEDAKTMQLETAISVLNVTDSSAVKFENKTQVLNDFLTDNLNSQIDANSQSDEVVRSWMLEHGLNPSILLKEEEDKQYQVHSSKNEEVNSDFIEQNNTQKTDSDLNVMKDVENKSNSVLEGDADKEVYENSNSVFKLDSDSELMTFDQPLLVNTLDLLIDDFNSNFIDPKNNHENSSNLQPESLFISTICFNKLNAYYENFIYAHKVFVRNPELNCETKWGKGLEYLTSYGISNGVWGCIPPKPPDYSANMYIKNEFSFKFIENHEPKWIGQLEYIVYNSKIPPKPPDNTNSLQSVMFVVLLLYKFQLLFHWIFSSYTQGSRNDQVGAYDPPLCCSTVVCERLAGLFAPTATEQQCSGLLLLLLQLTGIRKLVTFTTVVKLLLYTFGCFLCLLLSEAVFHYTHCGCFQIVRLGLNIILGVKDVFEKWVMDMGQIRWLMIVKDGQGYRVDPVSTHDFLSCCFAGVYCCFVGVYGCPNSELKIINVAVLNVAVLNVVVLIQAVLSKTYRCWVQDMKSRFNHWLKLLKRAVLSSYKGLFKDVFADIEVYKASQKYREQMGHKKYRKLKILLMILGFGEKYMSIKKLSSTILEDKDVFEKWVVDTDQLRVNDGQSRLVSYLVS